jgi:Protein of unknown function (DUF3352)
MPENKSKFLIPVIGATVVVAGSIAAFMYLKGGAGGDASGALSSAKVIPDKAVMATYITTDTQAWAKLQQFGSPEAQKLVAQGLESINKDLFSDSNISFDKDLKPWVGGVMIALLPPQATKNVQSTQPIPSPTAPKSGTPTPNTPTPNASKQPNVLMVVGIKDKLSALNFANKLKQEKGVTTKEIDYKGEKITETSGKGTPTYSTILNNTYIVISPEKQSVEQAIDTSKGQPSFASKQGAENLLSKGGNVQNILAQVYVPDYAGMVEELNKSNPQASALSPQTLTQIKQIKSVVASLGVDDAGVRMKAVANLDDKLTKYQYQESQSQIVSQFPTDTIALVSGQGINRLWSGMVEQSKNDPDFKQVIEQMRQQTKSANIDLDKDIFSWMDKEFGLGIIKSDQGLLASFGFGGGFVFDTTDRKTAEATLTKLDNLVKSQQLTLAQRNINGKNITEWQTPQGALLAHGWLDNDTVFVALGGPLADTITKAGSQPLDKSDNFKNITSSLQKPNSGYFYLDMDKTSPIVNRFFTLQGGKISPQANAIITSIRGLGVTATSPDKSTTQMEMLLALKPKAGK